MNCKDASLLVSQALDRRLSWRERLALHYHLLLCDACTRVRRQFQFLRRLTRRAPVELAQTPGSPLALSSPARQRIRDALQKNQAP